MRNLARRERHAVLKPPVRQARGWRWVGGDLVFGQPRAAMRAKALAREEYVRALAICVRLGERPYRSRIAMALGALLDGSGK